MSRPQRPRLHRLPQRLDYTLIPAPLDLSLPINDEKSALPAIIVTPSSPSSSRDFSIAFLAEPPKPSLKERISSALPNASSVKLRTLFALLVIFIVLFFHLVTHRLAARRPFLDFSVVHREGSADPSSATGAAHSAFDGWLGTLHDFWDGEVPGEHDGNAHDFVIRERDEW